ncbi:MAG: hypothetical protein JWQ74_2514 [Marmoricola sp.]|nr:hypothetical protein [Marmoricola sp.]
MLPSSTTVVRHIVMPNLQWACGGNLLVDGGRMAVRNQWDQVTCPDCLRQGQSSVARRAQQLLGKDA